ncbi:thioredoxin-like domain-containing protein [Schlesneria sp. T3-172]|uniref:thioredoxin-like domain-containing protein n=1 Tax=Schlesneria sphaerica TaxID=3373610 RepID=UPI0037C765E4
MHRHQQRMRRHDRVSLDSGDPLILARRRYKRMRDRALARVAGWSRTGVLVAAMMAGVISCGVKDSNGSDSPVESITSKPAAQATAIEESRTIQAADPSGGTAGELEVEKPTWPEGATVEGRVIDHRGNPVANAEVILLGEECICVDSNATKRSWFVLEKKELQPRSAMTDGDGTFSVKREKGSADRIAIIADDPILWIVLRKNLTRNTDLELRLPESGSVVIRYNLPGKPAEQSTRVWMRSLDGATWNQDFLRIEEFQLAVKNPGERVLSKLPPGHYGAQRIIITREDASSRLMTHADRKLFQVVSAQEAGVDFESKPGKRLEGRVTGLENADLRSARLTVKYLGPEEILGRDGKPGRMLVALDVLPISSDGHFTIDSIPPGNYEASLYAVLRTTPRQSSQSADFSGQLSFTVPEEGDPAPIKVVAKAQAARDLASVKGRRLRVIDEAGKPVPQFDAMVYSEKSGSSPWTAGGSGIVFLDSAASRSDADKFDVTVHADGFAPRLVSFSSEQNESLEKGEQVLTLRRGQKVQLIFHLPAGMARPKGMLAQTYFDNFQGRARSLRQPMNHQIDPISATDALKLREIGTGQFEFWYGEESPQFHVAIHEPGFLRYFETGPFTYADFKDGQIHIDVPRPAGFDVSFEPGDHVDKIPSYKTVTFKIHRTILGNRVLVADSHEVEGRAAQWSITDLAPGNYTAYVRTQPENKTLTKEPAVKHEGKYSDRKNLDLKPGEIEHVVFRSTPYDPNAYRGDRTAVLQILTPDRTPAAARQLNVTYYDGHYGSLEVFTGLIPESGKIELAGITDHVPSGSTMKSAYTVLVDGRRVGTFAFKGTSLAETFEFLLAPDVGDLAPDIELKPISSDQPIQLHDLRGKVVFLEFWATWCGPCQDPMRKLNDIAAKHRDAWKDKIALVPLNVDDNQGVVNKHIAANGWTQLDHYWAGEDGVGDVETPAVKAFVVSSFPTALLIGADGRILWRGSPAREDNISIESRIEAALK